jgi:outer membrane receptor for ferrienterochelin and colicin
MNRMCRSAAFVLLFSHLTAPALLAGTTGTLAGYVKNAAKEPMIGASVIVRDLGMGAATDEKGFYILNNVPAGTHTLVAKMMGYKTTTVRNVIVAMDLRTTTNITMEPTVLKIAGEVTVTAERPLIQKDVTATTRTVMGREIADNLPINTFTDVIKFQPGVVEGHIRGGRETEILYLVDGLPVQQAISGGLGSNLPNTSVVDLTIQTGGFNAEYGNAMSGVVNAVTKSGGETFQAQAKAVSEDFGVESLESEGTRRYELNLGGPWTSRGNFFLAGNVDRTDTRYHQDQLLFHSHPIEENENATGKLTYRFTPNMRLSMEGL